MEIKNSVVVITGASGGIGRATALELAKQGANLVLVARREEALEELVNECENFGTEALAIPTDVSIESHVAAIVPRAIDRFGKIDVWINNAAVSAAGHFEEIPMEDFKRVIDINLYGYIYGAKAIIPYFKKQGKGMLINVSSIVAISGEPYFSPYVISKFAIRGLGISLNQELQPYHIPVCTVLPGVIDTPLYNQAANFMGKPIIAPGEAISAKEVAFAIGSLFASPQREIFVGGNGKLAAAANIIAPDLLDKLIQKRMFRDHFAQDQHAVSTKGNLYDPVKKFASISGGWSTDGISNKDVMKFIVPASLFAGAAIGLGFLLKRKTVAK
ncbi:MAG: SDR family NAD(P)-dependent oxidoreductase [Cytophagaceae bacterium]